MMEQVPSCFGNKYDHRAKECQVCKRALDCWSGFSVLPTEPLVKSGYTISILNIISTNERSSVDDIKKELENRYGSKQINIYYYLNILKKKGLIDVRIEGRQRYYMVR